MHDVLSEKQHAIISVAAFTASGELKKLETALNEGLNAGFTVNELKEVLIQLYAYAGFPRSLNALETFMAVVEQRQKNGQNYEIGSVATPLTENESSLEIGTRNQTKLVGQPVKGPLFEFAPAIDQFLKSHLFGDIFRRDTLDWQMRELATISALAALSGVNGQLKSHYSISLNTGLTIEQLRDFVVTLKKKCGNEIAENALNVLNSVIN